MKETASEVNLMQTEELEVGKVFRDGWKIWMDDIVPLTLGGLIATFLGAISLLILAPVLSAGLFKMTLMRNTVGRKPEVSDIFGCFDQFWTISLACLVVWSLDTLGFLLCVVPGLLLTAIWIYFIPVILEQKTGVWESLRIRRYMVSRHGFASYLVIILFLSIIIEISSSIPLLLVAAAPFSAAVITAMYLNTRGLKAKLEDGGTVPPPKAPENKAKPFLTAEITIREITPDAPSDLAKAPQDQKSGSEK